MKRSREPFFWALFSSGGMLAALTLPAWLFLTGLAGPLGWVETPGRTGFRELIHSPYVRSALVVLVFLSLFHWAHRFRYTLYDGLQLYHLNALIATFCYGGASVLTIVAAWIVWTAG